MAKQKEQVVIGVGVGIEDQPHAQIPPPEPLSDADKEECKNIITVFGEEPVRGMYSTRWQHRHDAIKEMTTALNAYRASKPSVKARMAETFVAVLAKLLGDSVLQVYMCCIEATQALFDEFVLGLDHEAARESLAQLLPILLKRTGDMNQRVCNQASQLILHLASLPHVGEDFVCAYVIQPMGNTSAFKQVIARVNILLQFLNVYGFKQDGPLSPEEVMKFTVEVLNSSNQKVRKQASLVVVDSYKRIGQKTEQYLKDLRPSILKFLKTEIEVELCDVQALADADVKTQEEEDVTNLEAFTEEETKKMQPLVDAFGKGIACLFSKKWKLRENALDRLRQQLELGNILRDYEPQQRNGKSERNASKRSFVHCCHVVNIGLQDSVPSVVCVAFQLLQTALLVYTPLVSTNDFQLVMENLLVTIIAKTGDMNEKVKAKALEVAEAVAKCEKLGVGLFGTYVMQPIANLSQWRTTVSRLQLLGQLVSTFGFIEGGLSIEATMTFAVSTFESPNEKVRKAAVGVILEVYKAAGNVVRNFLKNQKPALVSELKAKIMTIARKDRTKSAPIQRLANIVQPLTAGGEADLLDGNSFGKDGRPNTFPTNFGDLTDVETLDIRKKIQQNWQQRQEKTEATEDTDGCVVVSRRAPPPPEPAKPKIIDSTPGPGVKVDLKEAAQAKPTRRGRLVFT